MDVAPEGSLNCVCPVSPLPGELRWLAATRDPASELSEQNPGCPASEVPPASRLPHTHLLRPVTMPHTFQPCISWDSLTVPLFRPLSLCFLCLEGVFHRVSTPPVSLSTTVRSLSQNFRAQSPAQPLPHPRQHLSASPCVCTSLSISPSCDAGTQCSLQWHLLLLRAHVGKG